ncbi:hypothetical protein JCM33374_g1360 [Metschnikowia sp. JCM 33374]|nr:hypothetical protein JCM33374_g1360 [Metschnikowia sp. JCM 33374]
MYDSGAQRTFVCDIKLLINPQDCDETGVTANHTDIAITKTGDLVLSGQGITITIREALYSPDLDGNFISTFDIAKAGYEVSHDTEELWITDSKTRKRYTIGQSPGDQLFWGKMDLTPLKGEELMDLTSKIQSDPKHRLKALQFIILANIQTTDVPNPFGPRTLMYYHLVCCHASLPVLRRLKKLKLISYQEGPDDQELIKGCQICIEANLVAAPHKKKHVRATRIHERVHSDTLGPIMSENGRPLYITTITDEFTQLLELIITENKKFKTELLDKLRVWNNRFPEYPIRFFRSDNAVEMPTETELSKLGIEKEPIASYSPQQNGLAEVMNKLLISKVKKIVKHFEPHHNYFPLLKFIFMHAAYMMNHLPAGDRPNIPQIMYHNVSFEEGPEPYRSFGDDVTVKLNNAQEARTAGVEFSKFHNTVRGSYLGHHGTAGYKVLIDPTHVIITKDLRFGKGKENLFRYFDEIEAMGLDRIHPDSNVTSQVNMANQIRKQLRRMPEFEAVTPNTDHEEDIDALETAPLSEEVNGSYRQGHAVVPEQPSILTEVEVPDESAQKYSPLIFPPETRADQSEVSEDPRPVPESDLEVPSRKLPCMQDTNSMSLEPSRLGTNRNTGIRPDELIRAVLHREYEDRHSEEVRIPPVHEGRNDTNHSSLISDPVGSNDQDDGTDLGLSPPLVEEVSPTLSTRSFLTRELVPLVGTSDFDKADGFSGDVPQNPVSSLYPEIDETASSTSEPTQTSDQGQLGNSDATVQVSADMTDSAQQENLIHGDTAMETTPSADNHLSFYITKSGRRLRCRDRNSHEVMTQEGKRLNNIRVKHKNEEAWDHAEREEIEKFKDMGVLKTLTAIATENDFPIHHLDIKSAYLNAPLPKGEEIYVKPPKGHEIMGKCWLLKKSVYGMKQAGYEWNKYLAMRLDALGFSENDLDESVFKRESKFGKLIVALYVDDLFLVAENDEVLSEFKEELE